MIGLLTLGINFEIFYFSSSLSTTPYNTLFYIITSTLFLLYGIFITVVLIFGPPVFVCVSVFVVLYYICSQ